jgi:tetratricopeptide (TPR) repeat protein
MTFRTSSQPSERALKLVNAALALRQAEEHTNALSLLLKAQELAPDYAPLQLLLGLTYRDAGQLADAEGRLRRAVELDPQLGEAVQSLGLLLATQGRSAEAIGYLRRHVEQAPGDPVTLRALSMLMWQLGETAAARQLLAEAWQKAPSAEAGIIFGRFLTRLGELDEAEAVLRKNAEQTPGAKTLVEWAYALALLGRYKDAIPVLERVLTYEPTLDRALRGLADCYIPLGQPAEALAVAERALAINPAHCRNWLAQANALLALGRVDEALSAARRGAECIPPDDPEAEPVYQELRLQEAEALFRLGQLDETVAVLDALRRQFPTAERVAQVQATLLKDQGRPAEALAVLDAARQAGVPAYGSLAPLRYETLHLLARPADAWAFIEPLLAQQQDRRLETLANIGITLYVNGHVTAAEAVFSQLSAFKPDAGRFLVALGFIRTGQGRLADAEQLLQQALASPDAPDIAPLAQADLGYLHLITGDLERAETCLTSVGAHEGAQGEALLRVAHWDGARLVPDKIAHPSAFVPVQLAVAANWVALALARGQVSEAEALARQMIEGAPDSPLGYMTLGWAHHAIGRRDDALRAWIAAQERSPDPQLQQMIARWLDDIRDTPG